MVDRLVGSGGTACFWDEASAKRERGGGRGIRTGRGRVAHDEVMRELRGRRHVQHGTPAEVCRVADSRGFAKRANRTKKMAATLFDAARSKRHACARWWGAHLRTRISRSNSASWPTEETALEHDTTRVQRKATLNREKTKKTKKRHFALLREETCSGVTRGSKSFFTATSIPFHSPERKCCFVMSNFNDLCAVRHLCKRH